MTKKPDPYHIKDARNDAEEGEPIPLELSCSPADALRAFAASAGEPVDQASIDEFTAYCNAPVEFRVIDMELPMGECGSPDPRNVTSRWPGDMTRH